ncbi:Skp1-domain-containing protein [Daldinia caldariorum]|uniref:Skp1-domain-containing protein n=1 Tax=Daldinia caldariorum TaxID=326644 RepID=UPI002007AD5D|nr:Skp1-domain-containing protein [Daldinia caldariorum]KAI1465504.1 Skp1-domain-containing protein [Daldinia caldariorum]
MASDDANVLQLRSSDNVLVPITYKAARQSQILCDMLNDVDENGYTEIPISEVDGETLKIIVEWCAAKAFLVAAELTLIENLNLARAQLREERNKAREERRAAREAETGDPSELSEPGSDEEPVLPPPNVYVNPGDSFSPVIDEHPFIVPTWPDNYLENMPQERIFALITAANFFDIHDLFEACAKVLAARAQAMSIDEMRAYFGVQNDFTAEEEEDLRNSYGWTGNPV